MKNILSIFLLLFLNILNAQFDLGTWNIFTLKYNLKNNWTGFTEGQIRSLKTYHDFHYHEFKTGINYTVSPIFTASLAIGKYDTYLEGGNFVTPKNSDEIRLWPMFRFIQKVGFFKFEHRYRVEFRFTNRGYRNRFRYRVGIDYPFGKEVGNGKRFSLGLNNEIFFTNKEPYFERNRMSVFYKYRNSQNTCFTIGYLHQLDYKIFDEIGNDFLMIGYQLDL